MIREEGKKFFRISDSHVKEILSAGLIHVEKDIMDEDSNIEIIA